MRILVDQSYHTHHQTCVMMYESNYCRSQISSTYWTDHVVAHDYIMLEDNGFDMIVTSLQRYTSDPCTVQQFKQMVSRELAQGQLYRHVTTEIMTFLISNTMVNQQIVDAPWGHTGQIYCEVQLIMLQSKSIPKYIIDYCKKGVVRIVPKSLYTIEYLNKHTKRDRYVLLYIEEYSVKCIMVEHQQYQGIEYLNWGLRELKGLMADMNIDQYYSIDHATINQLTHTLINQAVDRYMSILGQRVRSSSAQATSIALVTRMPSMIQEYCIQYLAQHYSYYTIDASSLLPRVAKHGDVDAHVYIHHHVA